METRKARTLDVFAPSFFRELARGITPHEHTGRGTPKIVAFNMEAKPGFPRCRVIKSFPIKICKMPAITIPSNKYGATLSHSLTTSFKKTIIIKTILNYRLSLISISLRR